MSVQIHTSNEGNGTVVQLQGKVDATSAPAVEQALIGVIDKGEKKFPFSFALKVQRLLGPVPTRAALHFYM